MTAAVELPSRAGVDEDEDDAKLLARLRGGDVEPYAVLWRRHLPAAYRVAHRYRGRASAEDIVGEASLRVFDRIQAGDGPTRNFRGYFLTVVKSVALDRGKADLRLVPTDVQQLDRSSPAVAPYDAAATVDKDLVRIAFGRLSARDQHLLWHTAVLGAPAAVIGVGMGLSANAVSAAAMRARDALRTAYLDAHAEQAMARSRSQECRWVLSQMGRYIRGTLRSTRRARVERHLQNCQHAQVLAAELTDVNLHLPALMVPLIFVAGACGAPTWCSAGITAGQPDCTPQSIPIHQTTSALAGVSASSSALITKAAVVLTAATLSAGLSTAANRTLSIPSARGHTSDADMLRFGAAVQPADDGTLRPSTNERATTTGPMAPGVETVSGHPAASAAGAQAATRDGDSRETDTGGAQPALTAPAPKPVGTNTAVSMTGSSSATTSMSTNTTTVKVKKAPQSQLPVTEPVTPATTPTSPQPAFTTPLPPGQAKKDSNPSTPPPDGCKNSWSHARACRSSP